MRATPANLRDFLAACGAFLADLRGLIDQRLADSFPAHPDFQPWLLPYVADLLGVPLSALDDQALLVEVENAIRWRQRKGTLPTATEISQALWQYRSPVGIPDPAPQETTQRLRIEIDEGWKRVAHTPRVGDKYQAERSYPDPNQRNAWLRPPHGLAARTPCLNGSALAKALHQPTIDPQDPYQDRIPRTPDLRPISRTQGLWHPQSVLVFVPQFHGFFYPDWQKNPLGYRGLDLKSDSLTMKRRFVEHRDEPVLSGNVHFSESIVRGNITIDDGQEHDFSDCIIEGKLTIKSGRVSIKRCAIAQLMVPPSSPLPAPSKRVPSVTIEDSLMKSVTVSQGILTTIGVTVLDETTALLLHASDCLFAGKVKLNPIGTDTQDGSRLRYCSYAGTEPTQLKLRKYQCHLITAPFAANQSFGNESGVLPATAPESLRCGAEDGGELGAYHHRRYVLREKALVDKLQEYLPLGSRIVVIPTDKLAKNA